MDVSPRTEAENGQFSHGVGSKEHSAEHGYNPEGAYEPR